MKHPVAFVVCAMMFVDLSMADEPTVVVSPDGKVMELPKEQKTPRGLIIDDRPVGKSAEEMARLETAPVFDSRSDALRFDDLEHIRAGALYYGWSGGFKASALLGLITGVALFAVGGDAAQTPAVASLAGGGVLLLFGISFDALAAKHFDQMHTVH